MKIETPQLTTGWNRFRDFLNVKDDHIEVLFVYYGGINFSVHVKPICNLYQSDIPPYHSLYGKFDDSVKFDITVPFIGIDGVHLVSKIVYK
jgi:hypothetical protein